jgi:hypothetical protein
MTEFEIWRTRANGGDSRYAIALGLMAIADAIRAHSVKESESITTLVEADNRLDDLDEKFDALLKAIEGTGAEPEPKKLVEESQ